jgi:DNA primase
MLSDMSIWESLSSEDHTLLCDLVAPHGSLFAWLDHQHHEHGPQAWGALREGLRGQEFEDLALRVMATAFVPELDDNGNRPPDTPTLEALNREAQRELRGMLNRMLIESLKLQETQAIEAAKDDPSALARYRALQTRRRELEMAQLSQQESA